MIWSTVLPVTDSFTLGEVEVRLSELPAYCAVMAYRPMFWKDVWNMAVPEFRVDCPRKFPFQ